MATSPSNFSPPHARLRTYPVQPGRGEFWDRCIWYVEPEFKNDAQRIAKLPAGQMDLLRPAEQLRALIRSFCLGAPLQVGRQFNKVRRHPRHVFELKTIDVRVFGWVPEFNRFVACRAEVLENLKGVEPDPYPRFFQEVVDIRTALGLPCIQSENLHDHFSDIVAAE